MKKLKTEDGPLMNVYMAINGSYMFFFEGKWRSQRTMALMLKRRHVPEVYFRHLETGRPCSMVVGTWDMTRAEWEARQVKAGHSLHFGSVLAIHAHVWESGECRFCRMPQAAHDVALLRAQALAGGTR